MISYSTWTAPCYAQKRKSIFRQKNMPFWSSCSKPPARLWVKNTLLDQVWGDAEVNEESLTRCIYALRRILSEDKEHRYIETLYGQGYRFNRPVVVVSPPAPQPTTHTLAILPFQMQDQVQSESLHYSIVKGLSQYAPLAWACCRWPLRRTAAVLRIFLSSWINYAPIIISPGRWYPMVMIILYRLR